MTPEAAQATIFENVYVPSFVKSCAERGINFETEEDLVNALESVAVVKQAMAAQNSVSPVIKQAAMDLRKAAGMEEIVENTVQDHEVTDKIAEAFRVLQGEGADNAEEEPNKEE